MTIHQLMPNLQQPVTFEIKVSGCLDICPEDWIEGMKMIVDDAEDKHLTTTFICTVDQAALIGFLRRLYALGIPLISVNFVM